MIINAAKYSCAAGHGINEDSYLCSAEKGIFIVADGLGGHSSGEKASLAAVDYFEKNCTGGYTEKRITELMEGANTEVTEKGDGGKTTVAAAFTENGNFIYANAGDSRVYYFREGKIIAQTKDHSVCQASADMGMIRWEDIRGSEDRSRLLKVLGVEEKLNIKKHYTPIKIQDGDAFLLCSDGFWEYVYEAEMEADLLKSDNPEVWLKHMLKRHILRAENKGDNYTAICGMISLDGSETYIPPTSEVKTSEIKKPKVPNKKNKRLIAIAAVGVILIAAAIALSVLLKGNDSRDVISETTDTSPVSETTAEISETETDTETETEENETSSEAVSDTDVSESETETETSSETTEAISETSAEETETDPEAVSDTDISDTENETGSDDTETNSDASDEETETDPEAVSDTTIPEPETENVTISEASEEEQENITEEKTSDGVENDLP